MKFPRFTSSLALLATRSAVAFNKPAFLRQHHRHFSTTLQANVLKLSDPQTELLDQVDVFIFDCDGVIWRVRAFVLQ